MSGKTVRLVLRVRCFRCQNPLYPQRTFAERRPEILASYAQRTERLTTALAPFAGEASSELSAHLLSPPGKKVRVVAHSFMRKRTHGSDFPSFFLRFQWLSQRAGFSRTPICPSMLRDTYAIRFLQAGGELAALQEQLGVADLVSVKRYQHFCEQQNQEREARACSEEPVF